jgi:hypothetical protein
MAGDQIDREEEAKGEERAGGEHHSGPAKPVPEIAPERPGLRGSWSVRHRGNYLQAARKSHLETIEGLSILENEDRHRVGSPKAAVHRRTPEHFLQNLARLLF